MLNHVHSIPKLKYIFIYNQMHIACMVQLAQINMGAWTSAKITINLEGLQPIHHKEHEINNSVESVEWRILFFSGGQTGDI